MSGEPASRRLHHQLPLLGWLVLVWVLLWGTWSWANVLGGLAVALVVLVLLPLPPVVDRLTVRPPALLAFLRHFVADLVVSAAQVAWVALRPAGHRRSAIVQVQLRADSDLVLTLLTEAVSLIPGSIVLDLDREERLIAVHLLDVRDETDVERERQRLLSTEDRLVRAIGTAEDIAALDASRAGRDVRRAAR